MTASYRDRYSRFIPKEELGVVTRWNFGAVDALDSLLLVPANQSTEQGSEEEISARAAEAA